MMLTVLLLVASRCLISFGSPGQVRCTSYSDPKLLQFNGRVIVRYAYHKTLEKDNVLKRLIHQAVQIYEEQTCVKWIETNITDPCHKIVILKEKYCSASLDHNDQKGVLIFLHRDCYTIYIILHEMMHALGIRHTHQRQDRDKYVRVWPGNISPEYRSNFEIYKLMDSYGVPYDYQSIMHYGRKDFSRNGQYTLTPTDTLALFSMGLSQNRLRWSDAAMVNRHLDCVANLPPKCSERSRPDCFNGGYVLHNCKCSCPENTQGYHCETKLNRALYDKTIKCGKLVDQNDIISTTGIEFDKAPKSPCVFQILPKKCYEIHIEILRIEMPGTTCEENVLQLVFPGSSRTYCKKSLVPRGEGVYFRAREATIHFYMGKTFPNKVAGFQAYITYEKNITWPRGIKMPEVSQKCYLSTSGLQYEYKTPYFPHPVACFAECSTVFHSNIEGKEKGFMKLKLQQQLKSSEQLHIEDRNSLVTITQSSPKSLTRVVQMPVNVTFKGGDDPGNGFSIEMFETNGADCEGKIYYVTTSGLRIRNPIFNVNSMTNCYIYLQLQAETTNKMYLNLQNIEGDALSIGTWGKKDKYNFFTYKKFKKNIIVNGRSAMLYYEPKGERKQWRLMVGVDQYY